LNGRKWGKKVKQGIHMYRQVSTLQVVVDENSGFVPEREADRPSLNLFSSPEI